MKQRTKIFKTFLVASFAAALILSLVPTVKAQESVWYWTSNLSVPAQSSRTAPGLAVFNGQLHNVHVGSRSKNLYHSYYDGILWSEEVRISNQTSQAAPSIAEYNGELHMVHVDSKSTSIYHSTFNGSSWSARVKILNLTSNVSPAIASFGGYLHMLHKSETSTDIYHSTYDGTSWTNHGVISNQGTTEAPALAVYDSQLHMVHLGPSANGIWHSYYNGVSWSTNVQVLTLTAEFAPSISECNGELHLVHKGETTTDIYHSSYDGTSWTTYGAIPNQTTDAAPAIASYEGPLHIIHLDGSSSDLYESLYLSKVCAVPAYQPDFWNYYSEILRSNNCYNYSNNKRTDTFAQPGRYSGEMYTALTCSEVENGAVSDGISKFDGACLNGENKIALVVAPGYDYHWYRMDSNGYWSHKPGGTNATNLDNSGEIITNPETADRGPYTDFCGYFCTCSDDIQGIGHEFIRSVATADAAAEEPGITNGLKVTIMIHSGRPNPTYLVSASEKGNKDMIMEFFSLVETDSFFKEETVVPSILGYNGIVVEKIGNFDSFPYDKLYIYRDNIEVAAGKGGAKQFLRDGGRNLEDFLLQLALEKGALSQATLRYIK